MAPRFNGALSTVAPSATHIHHLSWSLLALCQEDDASKFVRDDPAGSMGRVFSFFQSGTRTLEVVPGALLPETAKFPSPRLQGPNRKWAHYSTRLQTSVVA